MSYYWNILQVSYVEENSEQLVLLSISNRKKKYTECKQIYDLFYLTDVNKSGTMSKKSFQKKIEDHYLNNLLR